MLIYHESYDYWHAAFRMILILNKTVVEYEIDKLKILDFYFLFPHLIETIKMPRNMIKYTKELNYNTNEYNDVKEIRRVFYYVSIVQEMSMKILVAKNILDHKMYCDNIAKLCLTQNEVLFGDYDGVYRDKKLLDFLVYRLGELPLSGVDGLKARTRLMEYKYDSL